MGERKTPPPTSSRQNEVGVEMEPPEEAGQEQMV